MGHLIVTQGPPASGKSTWAAEQIAQNPDWVRLELDQLRDEFAVDRVYKDEDKEKMILQVRDQRLLEALRAGQTVICSDTNLSYRSLKRLESLAAQAHSTIEYKSFKDVPVEECIERDRHRHNSVGEGVIRKMYARFRDNDPVTSDRKHLIVGDVHGDYQQLEKLLLEFGIENVGSQAHIEDEAEWLNPKGYFVVFLGDLNDPRLDDEEANRTEMSSLVCLRMAMSLQKAGMAEVLRSNHQENLINWYYGRRKNLSYGLQATTEEFTWNPENGFPWCEDLAAAEVRFKQIIYKLINWLEARPYFYSFAENGQLFSCAHAYYTPDMSQYAAHGEAFEAAIYGVRKDNQRYEWWLDPAYYQEDRILIAGHYHAYGFFPNQQEPKAILLDGECGCTGGELIGFTPETMKMTSV